MTTPGSNRFGAKQNLNESTQASEAWYQATEGILRLTVAVHAYSRAKSIQKT